MADRRTLVSYDDITTPHNTGSAQLGPPLPSTNQPPAKKRRTHQKAPPRRPPQHVQHWDDPGDTGAAVDYSAGAGGAGVAEEYAEEEDESRELSHQEIWDDSALIDAWNSATAEYEAYHGKGKKWKEEPVKKSPLWYNVPPTPSKLTNGKRAPQTSSVTGTADNEDEADSAPLDFNTFVPHHDPTLASGSVSAQVPAPSADFAQSYLPGPKGAGAAVTQDEAFEKAMSAMYWTGYWTAIYHTRSQGGSQQANGQHDGINEEEEEENAVGGEDADMDELVETQR